MSGWGLLTVLAVMFVVSYLWQRSIQRRSELNAMQRRGDTAGADPANAAMAYTASDLAWTPGHHFADSGAHHSGGHCGSGDFGGGGGDCSSGSN